MQSMPMLKWEENMVKLGQMTTYEQCMKVGAMLKPPLYKINDCGKAKRGLMDQKNMKGLAKVN